MRKLKEYEKLLPKAFRSENGQYLCIRICDVGENFFDYGEEFVGQLDFSRIDKTLARELINDHRIRFVYCDDCGGCAGW